MINDLRIPGREDILDEAFEQVSPVDFESPPIRDKIRFSWRPEDEFALEKIKNLAASMMSDLFSDVFSALDDFYLEMRVPEVLPSGAVRRDEAGSVVWKRDENGKPLESWSQMSGQDVEEALTRLLHLRVTLSSRVNELYLDAVYARRVAADVHDEAWSAIKGTQGDRSAHAGYTSREDRYHAYFRYHLYMSCKVVLDEVNALVKHLENVRFWRIRSQRD